jgi:hypothetical protein
MFYGIANTKKLQMVLDIIVWGLVAVVVIVMIALQRDSFNPPDCSNDKPYELKKSRDLPWSHHRSRIYFYQLPVPTIKSKSKDIKENHERFREFLREVSGSVQTKDGPVSIAEASGFLRSWSYKPFREGHWENILLQGIPKTLWYSWRGTMSVLPCLTEESTTSPLTEIIAEEELLIPIGGSVAVRLYPPGQPGIPKFTLDRHGDSTFCSKSYRLVGREIEIGEHSVLSIPRGWVYKATIESPTFALVRVPVWSFLSWLRGPLRGMMKRESS